MIEEPSMWLWENIVPLKTKAEKLLIIGIILVDLYLHL